MVRCSFALNPCLSVRLSMYVGALCLGFLMGRKSFAAQNKEKWCFNCRFLDNLVDTTLL